MSVVLCIVPLHVHGVIRSPPTCMWCVRIRPCMDAECRVRRWTAYSGVALSSGGSWADRNPAPNGYSGKKKSNKHQYNDVKNVIADQKPAPNSYLLIRIQHQTVILEKKIRQILT